MQDKVGGIMGGKVLDLPEIRIFHEGKAEGLKEGKAEGLKEGKAEGLKEGEAERKKLSAENAELEDEIVALKAELEELRKQIKK